MRKLLFLILVLLFLCPFVLAKQPVIQTSIELGALAVVVPKVEFVTEDRDFNFHVHTYNSTGHQLFNTTTDCYIHVYNNTGSHLINSEMTWNATNNEWEITLNDTVTANKNFIPYIVWCNNTREGGFFAGNLEVNDNTVVGITNDTTHGLSISLFILFATLIIFLLPRLYGQFSDNPIVNLIITRCCYVIGFYLMVMNAGIFSSIAESAGYATAEIFRYMWIFGTGGYLLMVVTALKTLFDITELYKKLVNEKRGLE